MFGFLFSSSVNNDSVEDYRRALAKRNASGHGVSGHSASSHSSGSKNAQSGNRSQGFRDSSRQSSVIERPRCNQPRGYVASEHHNLDPVPYYGRNHNYYYYPSSWTDEDTGQAYQKGYYDENGKYYEDVSFRSEGKYKDVVCKCEYCDTVTKIDWTEGGSLICPQCGGSMKILSALDEYSSDPRREKTQADLRHANQAVRTSPELVNSGSSRKILKIVGVIAVIALVVFFVFLMQRSDNSGETPLSNVELFGTTIYLTKEEDSAYSISDLSSYDRSIVWDPAEDCYYDDECGLWLWYNTDVYPNLWQYWYEPISGDYGDYGWMEYEDGVWYIEAEEGIWTQVPSYYDCSGLWHITEASSPIRSDALDVPIPEGNDLDSGEDLIENNNGKIQDSSDEDLHLIELVPRVYMVTTRYQCDWILYLSGDDINDYYEDDDLAHRVREANADNSKSWQYWYAPISEAYGEYGWMEWRDGSWYIETDKELWSPLPEDCDVSQLFRIIEGNVSNRNVFGSQVPLTKVSADAYRIADSGMGERQLLWNAENGYFQEPVSGLWLFYKFDVNPGRWQYWFYTISPDYPDAGWMFWRNGAWYVESMPGTWIPVPFQYDTSPLWHMEP